MYAADEDPIPGVDTELVVRKIRENGLKVTYIEDQTKITEYLHEIVKPGDKAIFFGGDDFFRMADAFIAELASEAGATQPDPEQPKVSGPLAHEAT
jgi:UDP-N-acetylmuramate-alanine ligase